MKNGIGTNTGTIIYTRKKQRGCHKCGDCRHLIYSVRPTKGSRTKRGKVVYGDATSYVCDISGVPTSYTKRSNCRRFESK